MQSGIWLSQSSLGIKKAIAPAAFSFERNGLISPVGMEEVVKEEAPAAVAARSDGGVAALGPGQARPCGGCRRADAGFKCPCGGAYYCSIECQGKAWREHRKDCTPICCGLSLHKLIAIGAAVER